jgi:hypothetical protein
MGSGACVCVYGAGMYQSIGELEGFCLVCAVGSIACGGRRDPRLQRQHRCVGAAPTQPTSLSTDRVA